MHLHTTFPRRLAKSFLGGEYYGDTDGNYHKSLPQVISPYIRSPSTRPNRPSKAEVTIITLLKSPDGNLGKNSIVGILQYLNLEALIYRKLRFLSYLFTLYIYYL